jgi:sensor histidine kinase YesM
MPLIDRIKRSGALRRDRLVLPIAAGLILWLIGLGRLLVSSTVHGGVPVLAILATIPAVLYWLALAPIILWLASELPLRRGSLARSVALHIGAAALAAALYAQMMIWVFTTLWTAPVQTEFGPLADWGLRFQFGLFSYGFILSWAYVHEYFTRLRERDVALARLETELAQSQLRALKAQLQPHFLFNTLHAITVLIGRDRNAATAMVLRLSDLLRMTLVDADRPEVPLERELRFLHLYLEIEQTRFRDRLEVAWDVAPGVERAAVPPLLLQPLVENALKHGIGARGSGGRVVIGAEGRNGTLTLSVSDNGPGIREGSQPENSIGIGLSSTRSRLEQLYGSSHRFTVGDAPGGGVRAEVEIPYHE